MKNRYLKIFTGLILIQFTIIGCKPKDCNKDGSCAEEYYRNRIGGLKNYLYALNGSYWIYKNTKTNELDTHTCISFYYDSVKVRGTLNYSKYKVLEYDRIGRSIYSTFYKTTISDYNLSETPDASNFNIEHYNVERNVYGVGKCYPITYPFEIGTGAAGGSTNTSFISIDSTLIIQGKTYYSVAKFEIDFDYTWDDINYTGGIFYWAKDVGIIKHTHKVGNYSWELIDFRIIK